MTDERQGTPEDSDPESAAGGPLPARGGRRGRGTRPLDPERPCLNCGDPTPGEYCRTCGQRKVDVQVSVRTLVMDVLEDQFILDKRLPRTLKALLFQPGHMTVEHVNGRIVRYIHPFRLFLVTSLLFFLVVSFFSLRLVRRVGTEPAGDANPVAAVDSVERDLASVDSALVRIDSIAADTSTVPAVRSVLEGTRTALTEERATLAARRDSLLAMSQVGGGDSVPGDSAGGVVGDAAAPPGDEPESLRVAFGWEEEPDVSTGIAPVDSALTGQLRRLTAMEPRQAAETLVGTFFNYAPTLMFLLLPVFAGVLKLLYIRRRRYYAEHVVFLLHVHSFVFLLAIAMLLLGGVRGGWVEAALVLWILGYILVAMKRVYGQRWLKTFAKYWILGWMYFWILTFTIPVAFIATILLF